MRNPIIQLMIQKLIQSICRSPSHTHIPPKQFLSVVVPLGPTQFNQPFFFIGILFGLSMDTLTSISTYALIHHSGWTQFHGKENCKCEHLLYTQESSTLSSSDMVFLELSLCFSWSEFPQVGATVWCIQTRPHETFKELYMSTSTTKTFICDVQRRTSNLTLQFILYFSFIININYC